MSNFTESELIPAALKIILDKPNGIATKDLIIELRNLMSPSGEDLEMLSNRNDDKFSQKVRNIKSHKTLENKGYAKFYDDKFFITEKGIKFLNEVPSENLDEKLLINIHKEIPISIRTSNVLKDQGVIFIEQLLEYTEKQLLTFPGAGKGTIKEIENILYDLGFTINSKVNFRNTNDKTNKDKDLVLSSYEKKLEINILNDWPISERTYNALKSDEIIYLGDLLSINFNDLLKLRNFGRKSLKEIKEFLLKKDVKDILVDPVKWSKIREDLILKEKENKLSNIEIQNNLRGIRKTLFKDFEKVKKGAAWFATALKGGFQNHVLGPEAPLIERIRNQYQQQILIKIPQDFDLKKSKSYVLRVQKSFVSVAAFRSIKIQIDVDAF